MEPIFQGSIKQTKTTKRPTFSLRHIQQHLLPIGEMQLYVAQYISFSLFSFYIPLNPFCYFLE